MAGARGVAQHRHRPLRPVFIGSWQEHAKCRRESADMFYPEGAGREAIVAKAKRICSGCEVRTECLKYALDNQEPDGIWGGMTEPERRAHRRRFR